MLIPLSPAASTCGCRCSAPPRGSVRWRAPWRPGRALVWVVAVSVLVAGAVAGAGRRRRSVVVAVAALLLVAVTAGAVAALRADRIEHNPVADLAADGAAVTAVGTVASDPHVVAGGPQSFAGSQVVWRLTVRQVTGRGRTLDLVAPVLVMGDADDPRVPLGATVRLHGRLLSALDRDLAALLRPSGEAEVLEPPGPWWRAAGAVRQALRDSVAHRPADQRALVPALVDGDDAEVDPSLQDAFRATGLTHLLAVSGTNLTLVVGFLLALARWCRVRGRWLHVVAAAGIVGFVLIARTEPSVLRAAVMGTIGLVALGTNGRHRALRGLGTAVVVLVLLDPSLAVSAGFALSVLATGGILLLAPPWRDALARWLPRWLAEAIAVPAAAQLACTPLVAAISGQVSLVAVVANLMVAPVVGPATVLGLAGGVLDAGVGAGRAAVRDARVVVRRLADRGGRARRGAADGRGRMGDRCGRAGAADGADRARRDPGATAAAPSGDRARGRAAARGRRAGAAADLRLASRRVGARRVRRRSG